VRRGRGGPGPEAPPGAWAILAFASGGVAMSFCETRRQRRRRARAAAERSAVAGGPSETWLRRLSSASAKSTIMGSVSRQTSSGSSFSSNTTGSLIKGRVVELDGSDNLANADRDKLERFDRQLRLLASRKKPAPDDKHFKGFDPLTSYQACADIVSTSSQRELLGVATKCWPAP